MRTRGDISQTFKEDSPDLGSSHGMGSSKRGRVEGNKKANNPVFSDTTIGGKE